MCLSKQDHKQEVNQSNKKNIGIKKWNAPSDWNLSKID